MEEPMIDDAQPYQNAWHDPIAQQVISRQTQHSLGQGGTAAGEQRAY